MDFSNNIRLTLIRDNDGCRIKTTLIVRDKSSNSSISTSPPSSTPSILDILGVEQVPLKELVPGYKKIKEKDDLLSESCIICHDDFQVREYKRTLSCTHTFHKKCIDKWLKSHLNCPMCRKNIGTN